MDFLWVGLQVIAAVGLTLDGEVSLLWASQCAFAVEGLYLLVDQRFEPWAFCYTTAIFLETISCLNMKRFVVPKLLMMVHVGLCLANCRHFDCPWQFPVGKLFWAGWYLNNLIIVLLICYCVPSVTRRVKEFHANRSRPAHA